MLHIFLSDEAIDDLRNVVQEQIRDLEKQIYLKKAIWNDLGNTVTIPDNRDRIDILRDAAKKIVVANPEPFVKKENSLSKSSSVLKECGFPAVHSNDHSSGKMSWSVSKENEVQIRRAGYELHLQLKLSDLKALYDNPKTAPEIIQAFGKAITYNKATVLRMFMREVPYEKINPITSMPAKIEEPELKCPDGLKGLGKQAVEQNTIKAEHPPAKPEQSEPKAEKKHNRWAGVNLLRKEDVIIPKFTFDKDRKQFFKNIFFVEESDGRVAIMYGESTYCTTKDRILGIPYPFPPNYFDSKRGWNSTVEQAVKKYRTYLAEQGDKSDPDRAYKPFFKTDTHAVHGEDYEKVEGTME